MSAVTFRGAVDMDGGSFVCRNCIAELEPGSGMRRETLIEDVRRQAAEIDRDGEYVLDGYYWGIVLDDRADEMDYAAGECIFCEALPSQVAPGPLP